MQLLSIQIQGTVFVIYGLFDIDWHSAHRHTVANGEQHLMHVSVFIAEVNLQH